VGLIGLKRGKRPTIKEKPFLYIWGGPLNKAVDGPLNKIMGGSLSLIMAYFTYLTS
jgi:hypothetical protein